MRFKPQPIVGKEKSAFRNQFASRARKPQPGDLHDTMCFCQCPSFWTQQSPVFLSPTSFLLPFVPDPQKLWIHSVKLTTSKNISGVGLPDPPPVVDIFADNDTWSDSQGTLLDAAVAGHFLWWLDGDHLATSRFDHRLPSFLRVLSRWNSRGWIFARMKLIRSLPTPPQTSVCRSLCRRELRTLTRLVRSTPISAGRIGGIPPTGSQCSFG